jgi:hypothetical protein
MSDPCHGEAPGGAGAAGDSGRRGLLPSASRENNGKGDGGYSPVDLLTRGRLGKSTRSGRQRRVGWPRTGVPVLIRHLARVQCCRGCVCGGLCVARGALAWHPGPRSSRHPHTCPEKLARPARQPHLESWMTRHHSAVRYPCSTLSPAPQSAALRFPRSQSHTAFP